MKKFFYFVLAGTIGTLSLTSCGDDDDDDIKNVPDRFSQALDAKFPGFAGKAKWEMEYGYYVAEFKNEARCDVDAWFDKDARWVMTETDLDKNLSFMPEAVVSAYHSTQYAADGWVIDDIDRYERPDIEFYVIEVDKRGNADRDLYFTPSGVLIKDVVSSDVNILPETPVVPAG